MDWIDGEARGSLSTIREARGGRVCSQEERACPMLSHGEESGRDAEEMSEAPHPTEEEEEIVFAGDRAMTMARTT